MRRNEKSKMERRKIKLKYERKNKENLRIQCLYTIQQTP